MTSPEKPNVLLIISDEHAPQTLGCMGADFARTPNIDRLAASGVTFENAYCNFSLCVPSRMSFMTGLLCHKINVWDNGSPLGSHFPTWAHMCRGQGYKTELTGKMHFRGPDQKHGFEKHVNEGYHGLGGFRWGEENPSRNGYKCWSEVTKIKDERDHPFPSLEVDRLDYALDFLNSQPAEEPFCLTVGFSYPHYPQVCTEETFALYENTDIPEPVAREEFHQRNRKWSDDVWGFDRIKKEQVPQMRRAYMAMVSMLDGWIGKLMGTLEKNGQKDNTVVMYTSDHGDMWGEHDLWGKNLFYEESARVPLIVSAPALGVKQGLRVKTPVSLVDVYPTLRDIVGHDNWNHELDGRSLWPACLGNEELDDEPVFCDYYASDTMGPERMIRWKNFKLNYYHRQPVEMYDLDKDPRELLNVADDQAYSDARKKLLEMMMRDWDPEEIDRQIRIDQNRRSLITEALNIPEH